MTDVPLAERVAGRTLLALLDTDLPALRRRDVFALLASAPPAAGRPVASWERLAREAGVVAGRGQWEQRLATLALADRDSGAAPWRDPGGRANWREARAERADDLARFVVMLADLLEPPDSRAWSAYAAWSRTLWTTSWARRRDTRGLAGRRDPAAEEVERVLARIASRDAVAPPTVDRAVLRAAVDVELSDGLRTVGRLGEGLFVGPIPLAVGIETDLVIVLGLFEGGLPGVLTEDLLLAEASRRRIRRGPAHRGRPAGTPPPPVPGRRGGGRRHRGGQPTSSRAADGSAHPPSRGRLADLRAGESPVRSVRHGSFLDGLCRPAGGPAGGRAGVDGDRHRTARLGAGGVGRRARRGLALRRAP